MALRRTTDPATEPITTAEAKAHLRVDWSDDDTIIDLYITAAREFCEEYTNRGFITQTWTQDDNSFGTHIELKRNPVVSVTSVKYYDENESQQTWNSSNYQVDNKSDVGGIYPAANKDFPSISSETILPVETIYVVGYGAASDVPEKIKQAIKIMVSYFYENREMVSVPVASMPFNIPIPNTVYVLLNPYRVRHFG